ncbi:MAG: hypothetical protein WCR20_12355 [Verrucomicrobiota bacterium]
MAVDFFTRHQSLKRGLSRQLSPPTSRRLPLAYSSTTTPGIHPAEFPRWKISLCAAPHWASVAA